MFQSKPSHNSHVVNCKIPCLTKDVGLRAGGVLYGPLLAGLIFLSHSWVTNVSMCNQSWIFDTFILSFIVSIENSTH